MSKIGTVHVEIKPVLNEDALRDVVRRIEEVAAEAVLAGLRRAKADDEAMVKAIRAALTRTHVQVQHGKLRVD